MSLLAQINLWLCAAFLCFLAIAIFFAREVMREQARVNAVGTASLLMDSAQAARNYTSNEIVPAFASRMTPDAPGRSQDTKPAASP